MASLSTSNLLICHHCQEVVPSNPLCASCHKILPLMEGGSPFDLLEISPVFDIDLNELDIKYLSKSSAYHPDKFALKSQSERLAAQSYMEQINQAYKALKCPIRRGEILFSKTFHRDVNTLQDPPQMLEKFFSIQETIEALKTKEDIHAFIKDIDKRINLINLHQALLHQDIHASTEALKTMQYFHKARCSLVKRQPFTDISKDFPYVASNS